MTIYGRQITADDLIEEYGMTAEEADEICKLLEEGDSHED